MQNLKTLTIESLLLSTLLLSCDSCPSENEMWNTSSLKTIKKRKQNLTKLLQNSLN